MNGKTASLSVVIISHNQRDVLRRCIDSVLQQKTSFPVEVIVSDDRSTDGTREMLLNEYAGRIDVTFCNSNDIQPIYTIERSSFNRLNGLKIATGKYIIHIDGDDFFTGTDLFQLMVDVLELHPECAACCQKYAVVQSSDLSSVEIPKNGYPEKECVISVREFIGRMNYLHNSCFCFRRDRYSFENDLSGIPYDDNTITARYLYDGSIAVMDRCDFRYVQYGNSSCTSLTDEEKSILFHPEIAMAYLCPTLAFDYMKKNLGLFTFYSHLILCKFNIPEKVQLYFKSHSIFIYKQLGNNVNPIVRMRYLAIYLLSCFMVKFCIKKQTFYRVLYRLAIGKYQCDL